MSLQSTHHELKTRYLNIYCLHTTIFGDLTTSIVKKIRLNLLITYIDTFLSYFYYQD